MLDFAQKLIDEEVVTDVEALEKLAGLASSRAKKGAADHRPVRRGRRPRRGRRGRCRRRRSRPARRPCSPSRPSQDGRQGARRRHEGSSWARRALRRERPPHDDGKAPVRAQGPRDLVHQRVRPHRRDSLRLNTALLTPEQQKTFMAEARPRLRPGRRGPPALPREPHVPQGRGGGLLPDGPEGREDDARARVRAAPGHAQEAPELPQRPRPHHRGRGLGQDDDARLDGRLPERDPQGPHHHGRGPDRGRPGAEGLQRDAAPGRATTRRPSSPRSRARSARTPTSS
jgi:hypothetical protein